MHKHRQKLTARPVVALVALTIGLLAVAAPGALAQRDGGGGGTQGSGDGPEVTLVCETRHPLVFCQLISDGYFAPGEGVSFTASVGGSTQTVTVTGETNASFRTSSNCGNSDGICYSFSFAPQQPGATVEVSDVRTVDQSSTAPVAQSQQLAGSQQAQQTDADDGNAGQYPCTGDPQYTCMAEAPTGDGVVAIHNDGKKVTIDNGNNGVDDTDEQHNYDATVRPKTREEAEARRDAREAVDNIPEDSMVVIQAANGYQSVEQQENAFSLEQQLWDRGEPYTVCFDPVTYTNSNGEEITVQADCVVIVPY